MRKDDLGTYANSYDPDQQDKPHNLVRAFATHPYTLYSMISNDSVSRQLNAQSDLGFKCPCILHRHPLNCPLRQF